MAAPNGMKWTNVVTAVTVDAEFSKPASEDALYSVEQELHLSLPSELRSLLLEFDGVRADFGAGVVWPISEIYSRNIEFRKSEAFRELYMPFDNLLFFGDDGSGDQFAFAIQTDGKIHTSDIFRWEHETDARSWFASHLQQYFRYKLTK